MSSRERARTALTRSLRESLPAEATAHFIGRHHTRRLSDNLIPGLTHPQLSVLREQLVRGAGGELRPTRSGKRPAHAAYSSAALAVNAFGRWLHSEDLVRIAGLGGFSAPLQIESRQRIGHGGGTANLDCLLRAPGMIVGVESKLTETLVRHRPAEWRPAYGTSALGDLLDTGWRQILDDSRAGAWRPAHLHVEQLIKHALALGSRFPGDQLHLVYVWWEPTNADEIPEVVAHRGEVAELRSRVGGARPHLHALPYAELFDEWEALLGPAWVGEHAARLRDRYAVAI